MSDNQEDYPRVQHCKNPIHVKSESGGPLDMPDPPPTCDMTDTPTTAGGRVSAKRQHSMKLTRHVSFNKDASEANPALGCTGRTGSMSGDLSTGTGALGQVRKTNVLLLYTGGALGWRLIPGGK